MARPWGVGVVALLVMGPLVLGGCSDTKQAGSTLPSTTKAAATSTSSLPPLGPADFPVPPAARQKTPDGVIAFTKYYVALMNHQAEALDSTPLRDLSRECQACKELADSYDQVKAAGQRFEGGAIAVDDTGSATVTAEVGETSFVLEQGPIKVRDVAGQEVSGRTFPLTKFTGGCRLEWDAKRSTWLMAQLDADPE